MSLPPRRQQKFTPHHRRLHERPAHHQPKAPAAESWEPPTMGRLMMRLVRPLIILLMVGGLGWGCWWFLTKGVSQIANTTQNLTGGVRQVAAEIWNDGASLQLDNNDADLAKIILLLRKKLDGQSPEVLVTEDDSGNPRLTHQVHYVIHQRSALTIGVHLEPVTGKIELAGYEVGADYQDVMREFTEMQAAAARRQIERMKNTSVSPESAPAPASGTEPAPAPSPVDPAPSTANPSSDANAPAVTAPAPEIPSPATPKAGDGPAQSPQAKP